MLDNVFMNIIMFTNEILFIGEIVMNKGFTLAEVLITLGIIGVVAALTLPSLITQHRRTEYSARLKKFYSTMEQAIRMSEMENGEITDWGRSGDSQTDDEGDYDFEENGKITKEFFIDYLSPYFKYTSITDGKNIIDEDGEKGGEDTTVHFADGSSISLFNGGCIDIIFDTNDSSHPNKSGRDQFRYLFCFDKSGRIGHCGNENKVFCTYGLNNTSSRSTILNSCKTNTAYCSRLLQIDGWEFKKDYPHRL